VACDFSKVEDIDMPVFSLKDEPLKEEENNHSDELDKYQEMRRLQREADTKVVFSKPIRQDPNRGMHFIKNLSSINQDKLGYSRTFLKGIKVETYY
jgi:hypothetical protein